MPDKKPTDKEVCPYCHQDNEGYVKMFSRFYLRKDHFNGWNLYAGKGKPLPIKFCPICGRPLEIKQTQVYSIQDNFCGVPCEFMQDKINSLQAENERLKEEKSKLENKIDEIYPLVMQLPNAMQQAKSEAYKECIEKAKNAILPQLNTSTLEEKETYYFSLNILDDLLKGLVGDDNGKEKE